ncbi:lamin tail domain-containing protein [Patescibacteria group bacterium]|nr:lamin tail domain-containing protein [Patescibacteria group bacterium]
MCQIILILLLVMRGVFVYPGQTQSVAEPPVVINELMWMGSSASSSDEWIELRNLTEQTIDLSDWYFTKKSGGGEVTMLTLPVGSIVNPNDYFLISNYSQESDSSVLNVLPDHVNTSVSLVNTGLQIKLYNAEQNLIDTADDGLGKPLAGEYQSGETWKSMERNMDYEDGTLETSWHTAEASYNLDPEAVDLGTPNWPNTDPNYPPIAEAGENQTVLVNETVYFDGSESTDPEGNTLTYDWAFGDGQGAQGITPTHAYSVAGEYEAGLTVSDGINEASDILTITVEEPEPTDEPPTEKEVPEETIEYSQKIRINELLPNPEGSDSEYEFIELNNLGQTDVDLIDWKIADSSREYRIKTDDFETTTIEAGGFFVINRTVSKIALNNSSPETVQLFHPDDNPLDEVYYEPPVPEGQSYSLEGDTWSWTASVTSGAKNIIDQPEESINEQDGPTQSDDPGSKSTDPEAQAQYDFSDLILITELLPNPEGPDAEEEYIEIANFDNREINLLGWKLTDTKTYYEIEESMLIASGEYFSFIRPETKISLNNSDEQLFLIDPNEKIISGVSYTKAKEGFSLSRVDQSDNWSWSTIITPARANIIEIDEEETETGAEDTITSTIKETREVEMSQIRSLPQRQSIKTQGVVVVEPEILGKQLFYVNNQESGIQIYSSKSDFPELQVGDLIEITGTVGESQGESKVNTKTAEDITIIGQSELPEPLLISGAELGEELEGRLVQIEGDITTKKGQTLSIDSGGEEVIVYIKKTTGIKASEYKEEDTITAIGLVSQTKSGYRILPRSPEDIIKSEVLGVSTESNEVTEETIALESDNSRQRTLIYLFSVLGALVLGGGIYYRRSRVAKQRDSKSSLE